MKVVSQSKKQPSASRSREVVTANDSQIGNLATPVNASALSLAYINNLPAYREGLTPLRRGLEIGMAHGYWLLGPFVKLGPLRDTELADLAGLLSTVGLILIAALVISLYAATNPPAPIATITTPNPPEALKNSDGWKRFATGFLVGGLGGAVFAYFLLANVAVVQGLLNL